MSNRNIGNTEKLTIVENICNRVLMEDTTVISLCEEYGIAQETFYKWLKDTKMDGYYKDLKNLTHGLGTLTYDRDEFSISDRNLKLFVIVCMTYARGTTTLAKALTVVDRSERWFYSQIQNNENLLRAIWDNAKTRANINKMDYMRQMQQDLITDSLIAIKESLQVRNKTTVSKRKGRVFVGGQEQNVDVTETKVEQVLPDLKAVKLAMQLNGLEKTTVDVNQEVRVVHVVESNKEVQNMISEDEAYLQQLIEENTEK